MNSWKRDARFRGVCVMYRLQILSEACSGKTVGQFILFLATGEGVPRPQLDAWPTPSVRGKEAAIHRKQLQSRANIPLWWVIGVSAGMIQSLPFPHFAVGVLTLVKLPAC